MPDPAADFADLATLRLGLSGQRRQAAQATRWLDPADRLVLSQSPHWFGVHRELLWELALAQKETRRLAAVLAPAVVLALGIAPGPARAASGDDMAGRIAPTSLGAQTVTVPRADLAVIDTG